MLKRNPVPSLARWVLLLLVLLGAALPGRAAILPQNRVLVGVLMPLTGELAEAGQVRRAALEIGAARFNQGFAARRMPWRVDLFFEDTRLEPARALVGLKRLAARGIRTVVGPLSSDEIRAVKPFADANGIMLFNGDSTASSLGIPGDNLFRFCPTDRSEGEAIAALVNADGKRAVVLAFSNDLANRELAGSTGRALEALGVSAINGPSYELGTTDFQPFIDDLSTAVSAAVADFGAENVGVFLASYGETAAIFALAAQDPTLSAVHWYGGDGVVQSPALIADPVAAAFAAQVGFPCPNFALPDSTRDLWEPLSEEIEARSGLVPDAFALCNYDAFRVAVITQVALKNRLAPALRRAEILRIANNFVGVTGPTTLDPAGDRANGNHDFFSIQPTPDGYLWVLVARYIDGVIVRE